MNHQHALQTFLVEGVAYFYQIIQTWKVEYKLVHILEIYRTFQYGKDIVQWVNTAFKLPNLNRHLTLYWVDELYSSVLYM